ncbi:MAG: flotillin family protein [Anaerolineae bacterium]|nr:flotillin family protein [Anaerolineae bacterium]
MFDVVFLGVAVVVVIVLLVILPSITLGLVVISERQVGVVIKKFDLSRRSLEAGKLVALNNEPGYQADTLAPGWHLGYWPWMYTVHRVPVTVIPQGEIGLVVANDGTSIPSERILGKVVGCDDFQNARQFLMNGGEKGRQLGILTAGTYRINTALFRIITADVAAEHDMSPDQLKVYQVESDMVGIVTTLDGRPIPEGEIAGLYLDGHDNFQNVQAFMDFGGTRGLQEQVLLSGSWNLNPWFVHVEQVPMTAIPIGYVGVVISFIGKAHEDISGVEFKHGDLVHTGHKGVWAIPLHPGKHPINTRVMRVELVPTTNIVLNWATRIEAHNYDNKLSSITVRSSDGFGFTLDVSQIIHIGMLEAPKVISRVGSVQNLVDHVLQPIVGNYFRNAAQTNTVLDFLIARSERQLEAAEHIARALRAYDVEAIDTLIGDINPPEKLMETLTDRKIAEEQRKTYQVQQAAQEQRQLLVRETAQADIQQEMVKAERSVSIAEMHAQAEVQRATGDAEAVRLMAQGEAEAIRAKGEAQADAYRAGAEAMGAEGYTAVQLMQVVGQNHIRILPEILVGGERGGSVADALLSVILQNQLKAQPPVSHNGHSAEAAPAIIEGEVGETTA